jgi:hypothetical protein|uniref:Uncharacterized protein n=1 Tax=viral metagenome TaxID=1070528 RepID=A0A6C0J6Q8_9ZZZZ
MSSEENVFTISPYTMTPTVVTNVTVSVISLDLGKSVTMGVTYLDNNNRAVDRKHVIIEGEEYDVWGLDDQYIVNLALQKLGLARV